MVEKVDRKIFAERLRKDWKGFVPRYQSMSKAGQQEYLARQGYGSLGALLAHIIAWWMDGQQVIESMRRKPELPLGNYDVDRFNAQAVEKFGAVSDSMMIEMFEAQRAAMLELVSSLSDSEIQQENINTRLFYEIIQHWKEHE